MDTETRRKMLLASKSLDVLADRIRAAVMREDSRMFPEEWEAKLPGVMYSGALRTWRENERSYGRSGTECRRSTAAGQDRREATYPEPAGSASPVTQPPRDVSELYHELLYAVARKFPGESRHETALRYIRDTEERVCETGSCKQNSAIRINADEDCKLGKAKR